MKKCFEMPAAHLNVANSTTFHYTMNNAGMSGLSNGVNTP
jgi:hypothetical protein